MFQPLVELRMLSLTLHRLGEFHMSTLASSVLTSSHSANSFALFLKSNRKWQSPPLTEDSITKFKSRVKALGYDPSLILPHSTYLINMANPDK